VGLWVKQQNTPTNQEGGPSSSLLKKISGLIHRTAFAQIKIE